MTTNRSSKHLRGGEGSISLPEEKRVLSSSKHKTLLILSSMAIHDCNLVGMSLELIHLRGADIDRTLRIATNCNILTIDINTTIDGSNGPLERSTAVLLGGVVGGNTIGLERASFLGIE